MEPAWAGESSKESSLFWSRKELLSLFGAAESGAGKPAEQPPFRPQDVARQGMSGIDQGRYGDCVFEASLAAVASSRRGQEAIAGAIARSAGDYVVTFPGDKEHPVTVTQNDLEQYQTRDSAEWAKIMETALVKAYPGLSRGDYPGKLPNGEAATPAQYALHLLTGMGAARTDADSDAKIASKLEKALQDDDPVTVFCKDNDNGALVSGHEWTVVACDPDCAAVTVRNPWGSTPDTRGKDGMKNLPDGEVRMPLDAFKKYFKEVTCVPAGNGSLLLCLASGWSVVI